MQSDVAGLKEIPSYITGLAVDSRVVTSGNAFFAIPGTHADGSAFIDDAVHQGACMVIAQCDRPSHLPDTVAFVHVPNVRKALAQWAAHFYSLQPSTLVAVTGTSGKSSVVEFTRQIFQACGHESASLGTLGVITNQGWDSSMLTTPDTLRLHRMLQDLAEKQITHVAFEASSHGLDQYRLEGLRLKAAAFTNLGRDHFDYHGTREKYLAAKMRLFEQVLPSDGCVVTNVDSIYGGRVEEIARERGLRCLRVGKKDSDIGWGQCYPVGYTQRVDITYNGRSYPLTIPLVGEFQISNALMASGLTLACGESADTVFKSLENLKGVPGRLEVVAQPQGALVVVDYAHKPEALAHALDAVRPYVTGRLTVVVGAGGDRDVGKRPLLGQIAAQKADHVIITDDNPRTEDPSAIRAALKLGAPEAQEIGDRREAITEALHNLQMGDVLVIAGKGHENEQIIGDVCTPFSDREVVHDVLRALNRHE
jgi:UDP-N-acetylmuramoyl-L-alanyl-D-glutamate--2,6-diaminopimelate ligase